MRTDRWLIFGGSIMLLAAFIGLLFSTPSYVLADSSCTSSDCYFTDTTLSDFVQGSFYATGLANIDDGAVQLLPMGLTSPWITDTYRLPSPRTELAAVIYHDIIYAIGGRESSTPHSEVFSATTFITGPIKSPGWQTLAETIPTPMYGMSAVISPTQSGAILYIIGGRIQLDPFTEAPTSTISYRSIGSNGAFIGNWTNLYTALPTVQTSAGGPLYGLYYTEAVVRNGNLYVIGGTSDGANDSPYVFHFPILDSTGKLGDVITETEQLPTSGRHSSGVATWRDASGTDFLYVTGGQDGSASVNRVPYTSFSNDSPLPFADKNSDILPSVLTAHGMVQGNGKLFLTGGLAGNPPLPSNQVQSGLIDTTGALHYWSGYNSDWIVTTPLPEPRSRHASVINSGGEVYVIGGDPSGGSGGTDTVYHGSTSGFGDQYAPQGNYLSRVIPLGGLRNITSINIGSTISNGVTMTVQYRSGTNPNDFANPSAGWTNLPGGLQAGVDVNTSFGVNLTASYIQYRAFFTSSVSNLSPSLNSFQVQYPPPPALPDFAVTGMQAPPSPGTLTTETITITVYAKPTGLVPVRVIGSPLRAPRTQISGRWKPPPPPPRLGSQLRSPTTSNTIDWFWVTFYADPPQVPALPTDISSSSNGAMNCVDGYHNASTYPPFIYYPDDFLYIGNPFTYWASCTVPANAKNFYAQIDTCDSGTTNSQPNDPNCNYYGYWLERDEVGNNPGYADNIIGPVPAGSSRGGGTGGLILFLPFISKQ